MDHDLGDEANGTGYDMACFIEQEAYSGCMLPLEIAIHSANPVGRHLIEHAIARTNHYWNIKRKGHNKMIGALAGDIIGSIYEWNNIKTTEFPLFQNTCKFTDDSVLTVALADTILNDADYVIKLQEYYKRYRKAGYGLAFQNWATRENPRPYNSFGNGAAMRISPAGWAYATLEETLNKSELYTAVTHSHPEGIKGAQATAAAIFMARNGASKDEIRRYVTATFDYNLAMNCDDIRPSYRFDVTCQGTVPQALVAFLDSDGFENAIRLAVSLGGDTDTIACITGGIAEAFYGIPDMIKETTLLYLNDDLKEITLEFHRQYVCLA